jgi:SAM-dependent methyltransferase
MREFELFGTVDAVICMLDSINYVTKKRDLEQVFRLVHNYLNPGGLFIFDVNSPYKLSRVLGNETFFEMDDEITWIWNNTYDARRRQCIFDLTFFIRQEEGLYRKVVETHVEKAYSTDELVHALTKAGLRFLDAFGELTFEKPDLRENRIFYVSSK